MKWDGLPISGTKSILQQAIRYGRHYGTSYVFVSHYNVSLILWLEDSELDKPVNWAIVDSLKARLALAFLLWLACGELKKNMKRYQAEEIKMKEQACKGANR